jgi:hypothetical protein
MNATPNLSWKVVVLIVAAMAAFVFWGYSQNGRYVATAATWSVMFLTDTRTGEMWRYYRNDDNTEGLTKLKAQ